MGSEKILPGHPALLQFCTLSEKTSAEVMGPLLDPTTSDEVA